MCHVGLLSMLTGLLKGWHPLVILGIWEAARSLAGDVHQTWVLFSRLAGVLLPQSSAFCCFLRSWVWLGSVAMAPRLFCIRIKDCNPPE